MDRDELVRYLDAYLRIQDFPQDPSLNGLQVEGRGPSARWGRRWTPGRPSSGRPWKRRWTSSSSTTASSGESPSPSWATTSAALETLFQGGINLYAAHLPLDAHEEVGNNFVLARELGLVDLTPWDVGVSGRFPQPTPSCRWPTAWASSPGCSLWCTKEAWTTWRR